MQTSSCCCLDGGRCGTLIMCPKRAAKPAQHTRQLSPHLCHSDGRVVAAAEVHSISQGLGGGSGKGGCFARGAAGGGVVRQSIGKGDGQRGTSVLGVQAQGVGQGLLGGEQVGGEGECKCGCVGREVMGH